MERLAEVFHLFIRVILFPIALLRTAIFGDPLPPILDPRCRPPQLSRRRVFDEGRGHAIDIPWIRLSFDPRLGATSDFVGDPDTPFHRAPHDAEPQVNAPWWRDFTRPVPAHSTEAFLENIDVAAPTVDRFVARLPAGGGYTLHRAPDDPGNPDRGNDGQPNWKPADYASNRS